MSPTQVTAVANSHLGIAEVVRPSISIEQPKPGAKLVEQRMYPFMSLIRFHKWNKMLCQHLSLPEIASALECSPLITQSPSRQRFILVRKKSVHPQLARPSICVPEEAERLKSYPEPDACNLTGHLINDRRNQVFGLTNHQGCALLLCRLHGVWGWWYYANDSASQLLFYLM
jgi:hypothetical protein